MDFQLHDRVAMVTGGASGIGRACVETLTAEGAHVVLVDRDPAGHDIAADYRTSGSRVEFVQTDLRDESDVIDAVRHTLDTFGAIDTVWGCAGVSGPVGKRVDETSVEEWDLVHSINVRGNFLLAKHTVNHLADRPDATMVFMASDSAFVAFEGMAAYSASKGALVMLTKSLSVDHPRIRFNALCPGIVDTPMSRSDLGCLDGFEGTSMPIVTAQQIALHALFLASPLSAPTNGTTVLVDHGFLARSAMGALDFTQSR